ncbi:uncharacterized protein DSM5745_10432 [Aspergillus mulundensis]|uniref:Uncharacterized protein n=1 Tax=Aspergillus mulundensis TaxID=1810919 RepID=A0A3D8QJA9_9EURO|nr:hypothetical protein DSM5745_10432 [Aspergillus mulundensis]RDW61760.1 hypothetical protein DSM5745_10432 [Aspergillus mulundensis]
MAFFTISNRQASPLEARRLNKFTDHVKGVMPVEEYLDRVDPYTTSTLRWPRPFDSTPSSPVIVQQIEPHREDILSILDAHNLPPRAYLRLTVHSVTKRGYPSARPRTLLSLTYITDPFHRRSPQTPSKPEMDTARDKVVELLKTKGIANIDTEIVFTNQAFNPLLFDLPDPDPLFSPFRYTIRPIICSRILPKYTNAWQKVGLFYIGLTVEDNLKYPTLIIPVSPGTVTNWAALDHDIRSLLRDQGVPEFDVEFWPGPLRETWNADAEVVDECDRSFQRVKIEERERCMKGRWRPNLDVLDGPAKTRKEEKVGGDEEAVDESGLQGFFAIPRSEEPGRCLTPCPLLEDVLANYKSPFVG